MYIKQVKRKCSVRGCKNTDCYAVSRTREVGGTVIVCKSCLEDALGAIEHTGLETKSNLPVPDSKSAPPLFFNETALGKKAETSPTGEDNPCKGVPSDAAGEEEPEHNAADFKCRVCGKEFDSERGLKTHLRYCKPQTGEGVETE